MLKKDKESFERLIKRTKIKLQKEWGLLNASEEEFRVRLYAEMDILRKELGITKKEVNKNKKGLNRTIKYFDSEITNIKEFINYGNNY